jgi:hypothetical protein
MRERSEFTLDYIDFVNKEIMSIAKVRNNHATNRSCFSSDEYKAESFTVVTISTARLSSGRPCLG